MSLVEVEGYCYGFAVPFVGGERAKAFADEVVKRATPLERVVDVDAIANHLMRSGLTSDPARAAVEAGNIGVIAQPRIAEVERVAQVLEALYRSRVRDEEVEPDWIDDAMYVIREATGRVVT